MTTRRRLAHPALAVKSRRMVPTPEDVAALNVTLTDDDWRLVWDLWRAGVSGDGLHRLLRLRATYRQHVPETDRLADDLRRRFARWLVATGRLHDGG